MKIDFFEEFPTEENLKKASLLNDSALIYIAAHSLAEFEEMAARLHKINTTVRAGYWPILKESYWISPFSYPNELEALKNELAETQKDLDILLDLELPILKPSLFFKNAFFFFKNKSIIQELFLLGKNSNIHISTAEYPSAVGAGRFLLQLCGISYSTRIYAHERIVMFYSSMAKSTFGPLRLDMRPLFRHMLKSEARKQSFSVGLGALSIGILGNEPILTPQELTEDLILCKKLGIKRVVIFRLGGLTPEFNLHAVDNYR